MIDIRNIRENPKLVKDNIKKKFQDEKIKIIDEILIALIYYYFVYNICRFSYFSFIYIQSTEKVRGE